MFLLSLLLSLRRSSQRVFLDEAAEGVLGEETPVVGVLIPVSPARSRRSCLWDHPQYLSSQVNKIEVADPKVSVVPAAPQSPPARLDPQAVRMPPPASARALGRTPKISLQWTISSLSVLRLSIPVKKLQEPIIAPDPRRDTLETLEVAEWMVRALFHKTRWLQALVKFPNKLLAILIRLIDSRVPVLAALEAMVNLVAIGVLAEIEIGRETSRIRLAKRSSPGEIANPQVTRPHAASLDLNVDEEVTVVVATIRTAKRSDPLMLIRLPCHKMDLNRRLGRIPIPRVALDNLRSRSNQPRPHRLLAQPTRVHSLFPWE